MASPFDKLALPCSAIGAAGEGFVPDRTRKIGNVNLADYDFNGTSFVQRKSKRKSKMMKLSLSYIICAKVEESK